jgi:molybdopterin synthase catalytic subunit/molybdopterin converting factor small subunit
MHVTVRLFAGLRERAGTGHLELELPAHACVGDALAAMSELVGEIPVVMAVNRQYAERADRLSTGDELALIPPVSGGTSEEKATRIHVAVTERPLGLDGLIARVSDARAGAIVTFLGVTREVAELHYEAYEPMAVQEMEGIASAAIDAHGLCAAAVEHRLGPVALGEASIAIAVSAPHRAEAYAGSRQIIDEIKLRAPIWKREEGEWVQGALPSPQPRR